MKPTILDSLRELTAASVANWTESSKFQHKKDLIEATLEVDKAVADSKKSLDDLRKTKSSIMDF